MAETKSDDKAALPADEYNDSEEPGLIDYFKMYLEQVLIWNTLMKLLAPAWNARTFL